MNALRPQLILDEQKCRQNINNMAAMAAKHGLKLRPHFKTPQSRQIGEWIREYGTTAITVSSLQMAKYFANAGWKDITVAFPVNISEIKLINQLAQQVELNLLAASLDAVSALNKLLEHKTGLFIKIDTGYGRTGIKAEDTAAIAAVLELASATPYIQLKGLLAHPGHSYKARSKAEIAAVHSQTVEKMVMLKAFFSDQYPDLILSIGDTPCCSTMNDWEGIDEIRPGNYIFYDVMQVQISSCTYDQIAVAVACPVVEVHRERNEAIIYGGAVHFSKDSILNEQGLPYFGKIVIFNENGWGSPIEGAYVRIVSQEHGVVAGTADFIQSLKIGDVIGILPIHSCLTCDNMKGYKTFDGKILDHFSGKVNLMEV